MCKLSNHYRSDPVQVQSTNLGGATVPCTTNHTTFTYVYDCWAEAPVKIARKTLTIKLDRNWSSFQLANNTPPLSVTGSVIAPSARIERASMGRRAAVAGLGSPWLSCGYPVGPRACRKTV